MDYDDGPFQGMRGSVFDFVTERGLEHGKDYILGRLNSAGEIVRRTRAAWSTSVLLGAEWVSDHYEFTQNQNPGLLHPRRGLPYLWAKRALDNVFVEPVEAIYLVFIGLVERLRVRYGIHQNVAGTSYVVKYGRSRDLRQRLRDHQKDYGEKERPVRLMFVSQVRRDRQVVAEASVEAVLHRFGVQLRWTNHKELVIIDPSNLDTMRKAYKRLQKRFGPSTRTLPPPLGPHPGFGEPTKRGGSRSASVERKHKKTRI